MNDQDRVGESSLFGQLRWFVRLRWIAGAVIVVGAAIDWALLQWHVDVPRLAAVGWFVLAYNLVLWRLLLGSAKAETHRRLQLLALTWVQLLLDMGCLTLLMIWTGGVRSPIAGFLVFHMVFASLLLSRRKAFASAALAVAILSSGMWLAGQWPVEREDRLIYLGLCATLLLTVYLANHITHDLRRQNRQIRAISAQLRRAQQAMIQHEKMVALGQMAAGVAHEVANPLASMDSLLQLMQRKPERLSAESLVTLRSQIERINQIVRQMKTFAHPVEMELQTQSLNAVVESAIGMVQMDPRWRTVRLEKRFSPEAGDLSLAPQALHQVLVNLVINALDATADVAQPRLTVQTARRDEWCVVEVTDNGHGIAAEHLDRLFEPFFTTKPVGQGTGLGLSISYSLVQRQGGSISVRSLPGQGTTFTVRLPATPVAPSRGQERAGGGILTSENPPA